MRIYCSITFLLRPTVEKEQKGVQKAMNGFLTAITQGIITRSTKDKLLELEQRNALLEDKIALEKARQVQSLNYEQAKAFLYYFATKQYKDNEAKNEFFNSFIYRVVLFDDKVYIFYNTSPQTPTKIKLDKDELDELRNLSDKKQSTQLEPLRFELGANGGAVVT